MRRNILVTNDDGIDSPGLWALARAAKPLAEHLYVIAPAVNQSAIGAAITMRRELHWTPVANPPVEGAHAWTVDGTPGDCVMIGLRKIVEQWVDIIVSGINQGANLGNDILASGTVGGALQGHFRGITSMAFSLAMADGAEVDWAVAEQVASTILGAEVDGQLPPSVFLNVNIPNVAFEDIRGILVTRMGRTGYLKLNEVAKNTAVVEREGDLHTHPDAPPGSDVWAMLHNYVSVSPLQSNLTDHRLLDSLADKLNAAFAG